MEHSDLRKVRGLTVKYFAYGSNMCDAWLQNRVPSARALTTARLRSHVLRFHKRSDDGSAKCNVVKTARTEDNEVYGVIFEIDGSEKTLLDKAEGLGKGYVEEHVEVLAPSGGVSAYAYVAETAFIDESLKPYTWYKDLVISGAKGHGLPPDYIRRLEAVSAVEDQNPVRANKTRVILSR